MMPAEHVWVWADERCKPVQAPWWKKVLCATHRDWILIGYFEKTDEPEGLIELCPRCYEMKVRK